MGSRGESSDPFDDLEENYTSKQESEGYSQGYELGKRDGQIEGYTIGFDEGAKRGAELGYFNGYTMTYRQLVSENKRPDQKDQTLMKTIKKYNDILELIDKFPRTNANDCEEKLSTIKAKFKQAFAATTYQNQENNLITMKDQRETRN